MILNERVDIRWHAKNKKHYEDKGYTYTNWGDTFSVKVDDLSDGSGFEVDVLCDYCEDTVVSMTFNEYNRRKKQSVIQKDACFKCEIFKIRESNLINYGVEYQVQTAESRRKISVANRTKYSQVQDTFSEKGCILLTDTYINSVQELEFVCTDHSDKGIQKTNYKNANRNSNICGFCHKEFLRNLFQHDFNHVESEFTKRDMTLLSTTYKNARTKLAYKCNKHPNIVQYITLGHLQREQGCAMCGTLKMSRENNPNWKGGASSIHNYLRGHIGQWKKDSMINSGYKCVVTGERFDDIHHLYSFNLIVDDVLKKLNIPMYNSVSDYTDEQIDDMISHIKLQHDIHPLGICLTSEIHTLFHNEYGYGNNTPEQFEEFEARLEKGSFDSLLDKKDIKLAI